ncbi:MAG: ORF6N domain-containing protein [Bacilli bacterium]|nr:ORF6N domain-containing protein [Bacilli bacterium]
MNDIVVKENISSMIYEVRDKYVILDSDLAKLFGVETKRINETVRNNKFKFDGFTFKLTDEESEELLILKINQNKTSHNKYFDQKVNYIVPINDQKGNFLVDEIDQKNVDKRGGKYKNPRVFTREGVSILSSIMRSARVKEVAKEILSEFDKLESENNIIIKGQNIESMIYFIRGKQVMLDSDLAYLYQVETKRINESVKNNLIKFPERFCFKITKEELEEVFLRSKISTSKIGRGGRRNLPYVFTEQGVAMLATVLKSNIAAEVSINIMDAFVTMKKYISYVDISQQNITNLVLDDHIRIDKLEEAFDSFKEKEVNTSIYFDGQIYDAYSKILQIFKQAKKELIVIDSYADNELLNIISKIDVDVILITTNKYINKQIIDKYNKQYHNLKVIYDNTFHDRFFILDKDIIYHCGSSINRIGYKAFGITKISDKITNDAILNKINEIIQDDK